jgi:hypothetical protein
MKRVKFAAPGLALLLCAFASGARAQQAAADAAETRRPLPEPVVAYDALGREAVGGRLRTQTLSGTPDAPVRNTRIVIENRSGLFYNYVSGWATFYGDDGVRCGEGLWKLEALAPREQVEVDTPGLRLTCAPATWRLVATTLLTRTGDVAKPPADAQAPAGTPAAGPTDPPDTGRTSTVLPPLEINVNGKTIPIQPGNPLEIVVGRERVRIIVQPAP